MVGGYEGVEMLLEGDEPGVVGLAHGHIGERQCGVDAVVEERHAAESLLHDASLVDDGVDALRAFVLIDVHHELVSPRRSLPVDGAEVVAGDVFLNVFELGMVAWTAYALRSRLGEIVADGQQLVLTEVEEGGIDGDILRFALREAPLNESDTGADEDAHAAETVDTATRGAQRVAYGLALARPQVDGEGDVTALEDVGSLIDDRQPDGEGVAALQTDAHVVVVAIGETVAAQPRGIHAPSVPEQGDVGHRGSHEQPQQHLADDEQRRSKVAGSRQQDDDGGHDIEAFLQVHVLLMYEVRGYGGAGVREYLILNSYLLILTS